MSKTILVTGGAGYIGSHTSVQLLSAGYLLVVFDNLSNSCRTVIDRVQNLTGQTIHFIEGDIRDRAALRKVFNEHSIHAVVHFAGLKAVGESETEPLKYFDNNVAGSVVLFDEMASHNVKNIVFSSSAAVYGDSGSVPFKEDSPLSPVNVYGRTKLMVEDILRNLKKAEPDWRIALLRYFNPVGANASALIGEDPRGFPNNLMPFISQVAVGRRPKLKIFGDDYPTPDGTGMRDYIHVEDLAAGHLAALKVLDEAPSLITVNLGTGRPYSVIEMIKAFEKVSEKCVPYEIVGRRPGDLATSYADPGLAKRLLGWEAQFDINRMCEDTWRWQEKNPKGYS